MTPFQLIKRSLREALLRICNIFFTSFLPLPNLIGDTLGIHQGCFGNAMGYPRDASGMLWERIGDTLGTHRGCFGNALGIHLGRIEDALGTHWGYPRDASGML